MIAQAAQSQTLLLGSSVLLFCIAASLLLRLLAAHWPRARARSRALAMDEALVHKLLQVDEWGRLRSAIIALNTKGTPLPPAFEVVLHDSSGALNAHAQPAARMFARSPSLAPILRTVRQVAAAVLKAQAPSPLAERAIQLSMALMWSALLAELVLEEPTSEGWLVQACGLDSAAGEPIRRAVRMTARPWLTALSCRH